MNSVTKKTIRGVRIYVNAHRKARAIAGREGIHIQDAVSNALDHYFDELYSAERPERPTSEDLSTGKNNAK